MSTIDHQEMDTSSVDLEQQAGTGDSSPPRSVWRIGEWARTIFGRSNGSPGTEYVPLVDPSEWNEEGTDDTNTELPSRQSRFSQAGLSLLARWREYTRPSSSQGGVDAPSQSGSTAAENPRTIAQRIAFGVAIAALCSTYVAGAILGGRLAVCAFAEPPGPSFCQTPSES
ncbi:hypothetical protein M231_08105 [Tremella mesenterica]|uniref:Uncharacterized protein n=1 Tax=Tremella mesenterica TaxID=5217 RepID=A0A4Q1B7J9_TREME|nr:hypothetical protein M231_08105 [Tremella mesenterica]